MPSLASRALWALLDYPLAASMFGYARLVQHTAWITASGVVPEGAVIYVNFHQHQPLMQLVLPGTWMMVSRAPHVRPIARYTAWMGVRMALGATGSGGRAALEQLADALRRGDSVCLAVDGPAGPANKVKRGCVDLSLATGTVLVPVAYECARGLTSPGWDRALYPTPFDRIHLRYGAAIDVAGMPPDEALRHVEGVLLAHGRPPVARVPQPGA